MTQGVVVKGADLRKIDCTQGLTLFGFDHVVHAAGAVHDALTQNAERWMTSIPLGAKTFPLDILAGGCGRASPHLILFSSVASEMGVPGQMAYAHANGVLDDFVFAAVRLGS